MYLTSSIGRSKYARGRTSARFLLKTTPCYWRKIVLTSISGSVRVTVSDGDQGKVARSLGIRTDQSARGLDPARPAGVLCPAARSSFRSRLASLGHGVSGSRAVPSNAGEPCGDARSRERRDHGVFPVVDQRRSSSHSRGRRSLRSIRPSSFVGGTIRMDGIARPQYGCLERKRLF